MNSQRSIRGNEEHFINKEKPHYDQTDYQEIRASEQYMKHKTPMTMERASDFGRSKVGEAQSFISRKSAYMTEENPREQIIDSQSYFLKENAHFEEDEEKKSKAATDQNFFKKDNPVRGDIYSIQHTMSSNEHFLQKSQAEYSRDLQIKTKEEMNEFAQQSEDMTGKSVSGESEVANHQPFNALQDFVNQNSGRGNVSNYQKSKQTEPSPRQGNNTFTNPTTTQSQT